MATIYKRKTDSGDTRWGVMIRLQGLPTEHKTFRNKATAERWAKKRETELSDGRHLHRREAERRTLEELVDTYLKQIAPHGRHTKNLKRQASQLRWWVEQAGETRLSDVTPALIGDLKRQLLNTPVPSGRRRSPATVNRYLAALSRVFSVAVKELGWVETNPVRKVERLSESRGRVRYLSDSERERLLTACRNDCNPLLHPLVAIALGTGGRKGELLGLRWSDVDVGPGQEKLTFHDTKNGETRSIALEGIALEGVRELQVLRRPDTDFVFPSQNGEKPATIRDAFLRAVDEAKIEDFRFHDLRHCFASYLAMSGATLAEIAEAMGHKTLSMVKRYAHLGRQHTRGVVARMHQSFLNGSSA